MISTAKTILNTYFPTSEAEYAAYQAKSFDDQHSQMQSYGGYDSWIALGDETPSLDIPDILTRGGYFTGWQVGDVGYESHYLDATGTLQ